MSITRLFIKRFGPTYPSVRVSLLAFNRSNTTALQDIVSNVTYAFTNSEPLIDFGIPTISRVVHVGRLGVKEPQPLDDVRFSSECDFKETVVQHWSEVLSRRERAVLISFGSLAKSYLLRPEAKRAILKVRFRLNNECVGKKAFRQSFVSQM